MDKDAIISECEKYRYFLSRCWDYNLPPALFIGLNPSTADAELDDPTIRRCINFAKSWGCGQLYMMNLFAYRATSPDDMKSSEDPIGPSNNDYLRTMCEIVSDIKDSKIIAAWGNHGSFQYRDDDMKCLLRESKASVYCLGTTKNGSPKHPLYIKKDQELITFQLIN